MSLLVDHETVFAGAKRRQGKRVVRTATAHAQRREAVHEQVRRIHSAHGFAEGDRDLREVRHGRTGCRRAREDTRRNLVDQHVTPRRTRTAGVERQVGRIAVIGQPMAIRPSDIDCAIAWLREGERIVRETAVAGQAGRRLAVDEQVGGVHEELKPLFCK